MHVFVGEEGYSKPANSWYTALATDEECEKLASQVQLWAAADAYEHSWGTQ